MLKTIQESKIHKMCLFINTFWILFLVDPDIRRGKIQPTNLWIYDHRGNLRIEMAKHEPARGPGPFELAAGRDWLLRFRPEFLAGLVGWACAGLGQKRDGFGVSRGTRGDPHRHRHFDSRALTDKRNKEMAISSGFFSGKYKGDLFRLLFLFYPSILIFRNFAMHVLRIPV